MEDVKSTFGFPFFGNHAEHTKLVINFIWASCLAPETVSRDDGWTNVWDSFGLREPKKLIPHVVRNYIETVNLVATD